MNMTGSQSTITTFDLIGGKRTEVAPPADAIGNPASSSAHDEWLREESLGETFPVSEPISPSMPDR